MREKVKKADKTFLISLYHILFIQNEAFNEWAA